VKNPKRVAAGKKAAASRQANKAKALKDAAVKTGKVVALTA
jgi:hypothetical protein